MGVDYRIRAISLLELVNRVQNELLIPDAFFQRDLVWREVHKKDFIKTILLGYPFPQIFISKGKVNIQEMSAVSCIVDGQQRTNAITSYIDGEFEVDGKYYQDLTQEEKGIFLKYEIAVIELELENDDPKVKEIFQRINRTSNSLTAIEKLASEFSTSEFMLVAKLLADQINLDREDVDDMREDPNIPEEFFDWARVQKVDSFVKLLTRKDIFTARDLAKKSHLNHVLNIMSTIIGGMFNRNEKSLEYLEIYKDKFENKKKYIDLLNHSAEIILAMRLPAKSYWYNKSNIFTLIVCLSKYLEQECLINPDSLKHELLTFSENLPDDYKFAATEAVNNKKQREIRNEYIDPLVRRAFI